MKIVLYNTHLEGRTLMSLMKKIVVVLGCLMLIILSVTSINFLYFLIEKEEDRKENE
jgi:hypothetical protein